jgi:hypothetical protein
MIFAGAKARFSSPIPGRSLADPWSVHCLAERLARAGQKCPATDNVRAFIVDRHRVDLFLSSPRAAPRC